MLRADAVIPDNYPLLLCAAPPPLLLLQPSTAGLMKWHPIQVWQWNNKKLTDKQTKKKTHAERSRVAHLSRCEKLWSGLWAAQSPETRKRHLFLRPPGTQSTLPVLILYWSNTKQILSYSFCMWLLPWNHHNQIIIYLLPLVSFLIMLKVKQRSEIQGKLTTDWPTTIQHSWKCFHDFPLTIQKKMKITYKRSWSEVKVMCSTSIKKEKWFNLIREFENPSDRG